MTLLPQRDLYNNENQTALDSPTRPKQNGSMEAQHPSTSFSQISNHYRQSNEQHPSSPDPHRNRRAHHNSPNTTPVSDTLTRASVLRDGSRPERESPLSLTYSSHLSAHLENSHQPQSNSSGPVDASTSAHYRNMTSNNCGEGTLFILHKLL